MYKIPKYNSTTINHNEEQIGEPIENKVERIIENNEPIKDGLGEVIYTERKDGVKPGYNIRTDRFEIALDAMDKISKSKTANREWRLHKKEEQKEGGEATSKQVFSVV